MMPWCCGEGVKAPNAFAAVESSYENRVTDEFVEPVVIVDETGSPGTGSGRR
jgi:2,3-bisphosphoglycerate-independent phosphoglycerate mutase